MSILSQISCTPCHAGEAAVSDEEIAVLHPFIPAWKIVDEEEGRRLRNTFTFDDEETARAFVGAVDELARKEDHHPVLDRRGDRVTVDWWTHSLRDLHPNDFIMAAKTDGAYTLTVVGAEGDMVTSESLPTLAEVPRFRELVAHRAAGEKASGL